jgi:hypothetical protein
MWLGPRAGMDTFEARKICCLMLKVEPHTTGYLAPPSLPPHPLPPDTIVVLLVIAIAFTLSCKGDIIKTGNFVFDHLRAHGVGMTGNQL